MLEVVAPPPQGGRLKNKSGARTHPRKVSEKQIRGPKTQTNGGHFPAPVLITTLLGGRDFAPGKRSQFFRPRTPATQNHPTPLVDVGAAPCVTFSCIWCTDSCSRTVPRRSSIPQKTHAPSQAVGSEITSGKQTTNMIDNRVRQTRWHDTWLVLDRKMEVRQSALCLNKNLLPYEEACALSRGRL